MQKLNSSGYTALIVFSWKCRRSSVRIYVPNTFDKNQRLGPKDSDSLKPSVCVGLYALNEIVNIRDMT